MRGLLVQNWGGGVMYWDGIFGVNHKCKETDSKASFLIEVMMMSCSSSLLWDTNFIDSQQLENLGTPLFSLLQLLFSFFGESNESFHERQKIIQIGIM